jgi:hypothetical protein
MAVSVVNLGSANRREGTRTDEGKQCGTNFAYLNIHALSELGQDHRDKVLALSPKLSSPTARPPRMTVK